MDLTTLPFDQHGRYRMVADALDAARPLLGGRLRVLDVGGHFRTRRGEELLPARAFLPGDDVTVVDMLDSQLPGFVRGDGRGLAFGDAAFDVAISCDALEHVPPGDREAFWGELLRVARYGVALIAPSRSPHAEAAERLVAAYIRAEMGEEQPQLAEHRAYGLPDRAEVEAMLARMGLRHRSLPQGNVHAWVAMMLARHTRPLHADADFGEQLDSYFTRFLQGADRQGPAYRRLFLVEKAGGWVDAAAAALEAARGGAPEGGPGFAELVGWQLQAEALRARTAQDERVAWLEREAARQAERADDLERRAAWLAGQAEAARRELERVRSGRALRLLGLLRRR